MKKYFIVTIVLIVVLLSGCSEGKESETASLESGASSTLPDVVPIVDQGFKSDIPYEVIHYIKETRYYYVQQTEGEVTPESADSIVKELYSKEAFSDDGGTLGNVLIYDSNKKLTKGKSVAFEIEESAEYVSRDKVIHVNGESYPFEPAYK